MELIESYRKRVEEVNIFINFVSETDKIETYKQTDRTLALNVSRDLQKILRANCFLLLYNLVEATIKNSIWQIYDTIEDDKLQYKDISDKLKDIWLEEKRKEFSQLTSSTMVKNTIKSYIENGDKGQNIVFSKERISISGNLDYRSINNLITEYGFFGQIKVSNLKLLKKALLKIKSERNALAHGNKSFRECAEIITIQQIIEYRDVVINFLEQITKNVVKYLEKEMYKN
jgi:tRNA U34 5-carboxymethylaminomethyl modifying enzyme MnmG/GidA